MSNEKIFTGKVEIPDSVQDKADNAINSIRSQESVRAKRERNKFMRSFIAVAACAVILISAFQVPKLINVNNHNKGKTVEVKTEENDNSHALSKNLFSIKAFAAEMKVGEPVHLSIEDVNGIVMSTTFADGPYTVEQCFEMDFTVTGEDISTVTYSVTNGVFKVDYPEGKNIVVSGKEDTEYKSKLSYTGSEYYDETLDEKVLCAEDYYSEFTLDYDRQTAEHASFMVAAITNDKKSFEDLIIRGSGVPAEEQKLNIRETLKNTVITISVQYKDGTTASQDVVYDTMVKYSKYGYPILWYNCRCVEDEPMADFVVDEEDNFITEDLSSYPVQISTEIIDAEGGIQYGDKLVVELEKSKNEDNTEWEDLGEKTIYLSMSGSYLFYPELNPDEGYGVDFDKQQMAIAAVNSVIGKEAGAQFIVYDEVAYRYTVKSYVSWATEQEQNYQEYINQMSTNN